MQKFAILFGTFNPIHYGHLAIANAAREQYNLNKVFFVPSFKPPHRNDNPIEAKLRLEMVHLAIKDNPFFSILDIEIQRQGISYSIDSIHEINKLIDYPHQLYLIIGADNINKFSTWHNYKEILNLCKLLIAPRNDILIDYNLNRKYFIKWLRSQKLPQEIYQNIEPILLPSNNLSSSYIREKITARQSIKYLVPEMVINFINEQKLYR